MRPNYYCILLFLIPLLLPAQEDISGTILSATDSTSLASVSIYFDGTTIGTSTGSDGTFRITKPTGETNPLIISFLGYETIALDVKDLEGELRPIFLQEKPEQLAEVIVEPDTWSREKKLNIFRREFLGNSLAATRCRIKNEDALVLHYRPSTQTLTAEATEPLLIVNRHLGYEVKYDLESFKVEFSTGTSGFTLAFLVFYQGYSHFRELRRKPRKKILNNRELTYKGSSLHFMRALKDKSLTEENFRIFYESFEAPPYEHFKIKKMRGLVQVKLTAEKISILYGDLEQSGLQTRGIFYIDSSGNYTPPHFILFSGEMGKTRVAGMLPLDYFPKN